MKIYWFSFFLLMAISVLGQAQDSLQFKEEVEALQNRYDTVFNPSQETIVFTGSSSIRMWQDVQERFPNHRVVNTGFGGSQATDLSYYIYDLILRFSPKKVFIYEGDNDLFAGVAPEEVLKNIQYIIDGIHRNNPATEVVLIAAKPSIARWRLKNKYKRLNRKLEKLADDNPMVEYADVWTPMLDGRHVKTDIFIEDGLHMNASGYSIWYEVMKPFMD
ncbi:MAG: GDSL-type esterase/lipase family protein [Pricia sp.]